MKTRLKLIPAVFVALIEKDQVLLQRRANTGWLDGFYDLPSGHVEPNESFKAAAVRELKEETGIILGEDELRLFYVYQNFGSPERPYFGLMFRAERWQGRPKIMEPQKCDDMRMFALEQLPDKLVPYVKEALSGTHKEKVEFGFFDEADLGK